MDYHRWTACQIKAVHARLEPTEPVSWMVLTAPQIWKMVRPIGRAAAAKNAQNGFLTYRTVAEPFLEHRSVGLLKGVGRTATLRGKDAGR
jgi:hypothetical protein